MIAGGFSDASLRLWDNTNTSISAAASGFSSATERQSEQSIATLIGHTGPVCAATFVPNKPFVLSASEDSTVRLWSVERKCAVGIYQGHEHAVRNTGCVDPPHLD